MIASKRQERYATVSIMTVDWWTETTTTTTTTTTSLHRIIRCIFLEEYHKVNTISSKPSTTCTNKCNCQHTTNLNQDNPASPELLNNMSSTSTNQVSRKSSTLHNAKSGKTNNNSIRNLPIVSDHSQATIPR
jgi:hypothetical protein